MSGTTAPGADYTALASSVTLAAGLVSAVVTIRPLDDTLVEASESIVLSLTPAASYTVGSPATATVNVVSDDGSSTLTSYMATREFDNKNGKAYFAAGRMGRCRWTISTAAATIRSSSKSDPARAFGGTPTIKTRPQQRWRRG